MLVITDHNITPATLRQVRHAPAVCLVTALKGTLLQGRGVNIMGRCLCLSIDHAHYDF